MASETEIVNAAIVMLGQAPIVTITEASKEAIFARAILNTELGELLAEADWHCAYKTSPLTKVQETPTGFVNSYQLPVDCVRPVKIELDGYPFFVNQLTYDTSTKSKISAYKIVKRKLWTNAEEVVLGYVSRVAVSELDDTTTGVLISKIALALSYSLTTSNTNYQLREQSYKNKLKNAKAKNALLMQQFHAEAEALRVRRG